MERCSKQIGLFLIVHLFVMILLGPSLAQEREIRIADSTGDWGYPNPYRHYPRGPGYIRMSWVFDTLVWKDEKGFIPALADSWSYDPGKKAFLFKLNRKAQWHDGQPLTADDVIFTLNYFKKHPYPWVALDLVDRGQAPDPYTVIIHLLEPYAAFISDVGGTMPVLPRHIWEKVEKPQPFDDPKAFVGSGPFRFKDFNKAQGTYLYEAFKGYYQGFPKVDRLIYIKSGQPLISLKTGQADLAMIQPDMAEGLQKSGFAVIRDERGWNKKLRIKHKKPPLDDKRFRQALAYAIDRQEIIKKSQRGFGSVASMGLLWVDHEMYNPNTPTYPFDPHKARSLIESIGYQKDTQGVYRKEGRPLRLELLASKITVAGQHVPDRDGEVMKKQLEAVGILVDLVVLEQATTDSKVKNWDFDLAISGHGGISGDPKILNEMISPRYSAGSVNSARFDGNSELNRLLEEQIRAMDPEKRRALIFKIQEVYAEELPAISLYYPDSMAAYNPKKGVAWYYTRGGISKGIPIPQNKMSLIK